MLALGEEALTSPDRPTSDVASSEAPLARGAGCCCFSSGELSLLQRAADSTITSPVRQFDVVRDTTASARHYLAGQANQTSPRRPL